MARLKVTTRNRVGATILITENYSHGQFCLDSCKIEPKKYFEFEYLNNHTEPRRIL